MKTQKRILVTGAGGFIGHHLVKRLKRDGHWVRGVDIKYPEYEQSPGMNLKSRTCAKRMPVYSPPAAVSMRYTTSPRTWVGLATSRRFTPISAVTIFSSTLTCSRLREQNGVKRFLFSSSACVYAQGKQKDPDVTPLREEDAFPADPEPGYGWEKLFAEELCRYYWKDYVSKRASCASTMFTDHSALTTAGKKKHPRQSRKVALVHDDGEIEVWGDGEQTRSFMYVDDCVEGLIRIMASDYRDALNLGTDELVSINQLVDMVASAAGKRVNKRHNLSGPQGVRGRNSENSRTREVLGWEPSISLHHGLAITYRWIASQLLRREPVGVPGVTRVTEDALSSAS